MLVADISCDVNGSIEFLDRTTNVDSPYFQYDPILKREVSEQISSNGVTMMGVDILPTELPRDSSEYFGDAFLPVLEKYLDSKDNKASSELSELVSFNSYFSVFPFPCCISHRFRFALCLDECLHCGEWFVDARLATLGKFSEASVW